MATQDLWGELPLAEEVRSPLTILKEQAALLGQKTNNLLQGHVNFHRSTIDPQFTADFDIEAPLLDSYFYHVLTIRYPVTLYPVIVEPDSNTQSSPRRLANLGFGERATIEPDSNAQDPLRQVLTGSDRFECDNEESFIQTLGSILARPQVKKVIGLLVAQSRETN